MGAYRDSEPKVFGAVAAYETPEALLDATHKAREAGYRSLEAYTPVPVHGLTDALNFDDNKLGWLVFGAGVVGAAAGLGLQLWTSMVAYAHNVGGKPYISLPMFFPVLYECTILFAAGAATFGMLALNGLPKPHHPVMNAEAMQRASQDRFVLCIEANDPNFDEDKARAFLKSTGPESVETVWTSDGY